MEFDTCLYLNLHSNPKTMDIPDTEVACRSFCCVWMELQIHHDYFIKQTPSKCLFDCLSHADALMHSNRQLGSIGTVSYITLKILCYNSLGFRICAIFLKTSLLSTDSYSRIWLEQVFLNKKYFPASLADESRSFTLCSHQLILKRAFQFYSFFVIWKQSLAYMHY